jgi:proteasome lid subunit RPN8/RPN11
MIDKKIKNFIQKQAKDNLPNECCGFIIKENEKFKCIPTKNISKDPKENFEISSLDFLKIKQKYKKIYYIYHSHTNDNQDLTEKDKNCSENLVLPIIMYNLKHDFVKIYEPIKVKNEYIGRYYEHGKYDCFKLIEDFYKNELNINFNYDRNFYKKSLIEMDIKNEIFKYFEQNNFEIITNNTFKINDILFMDFFLNKNPKHFALYLGDDKILHQPMGGFSKIENYSDFYKKKLYAIFRRKE